VPDIRHRVGISAAQERVYAMLAGKDGLAAFWTPQVEGDSEAGGRLRFFFGRPEPSAVMEVVELSPHSRVRWNCVAGPPEWVGTTVTFDLKTSGGETVLLFTHANWREPVEFMHHCSIKWATYLIGLRNGLQGGAFTAFPNDTTVSSSWRWRRPENSTMACARGPVCCTLTPWVRGSGDSLALSGASPRRCSSVRCWCAERSCSLRRTTGPGSIPPII
jgi:uncharacterized protein YndB with AHSA1/START domain